MKHQFTAMTGVGGERQKNKAFFWMMQHRFLPFFAYAEREETCVCVRAIVVDFDCTCVHPNCHSVDKADRILTLSLSLFARIHTGSLR